MLDPITLFATAQAAIAGAKAVIQAGQDVQGIVGDMMKFFEAKDQLAKIAAEPKKSFAQSDTAAAMQTVMHLKSLNDAETQLKDMLIWSGNASVYYAMIKERNAIVAKRKAAELEEQKKQEQRKKDIGDIISIGLIALILAATITLVAWFTMFITDKP